MSNKIKLFLLLFTALFLFSCSKGEKYIYPKHHFASLRTASGKHMLYIYWGDKLIDLGEKVQNEKMKDLYKVKLKTDGTEGYISKSQAVRKVLKLGVILNKVVVYNKPSLSGRPKAITPPVLVYVMDEKKVNEKAAWYKVRFYTPSKTYRLDPNAPRYWGSKWIKAEELSLKEGDFEILRNMQLSLGRYRHALSNVQKNPKAKKALEDLVAAEKGKLQSLMDKYSDSASKALAEKAITLMSSGTDDTQIKILPQDNQNDSSKKAIDEADNNKEDEVEE